MPLCLLPHLGEVDSLAHRAASLTNRDDALSASGSQSFRNKIRVGFDRRHLPRQPRQEGQRQAMLSECVCMCFNVLSNVCVYVCVSVATNCIASI